MYNMNTVLFSKLHFRWLAFTNNTTTFNIMTPLTDSPQRKRPLWPESIRTSEADGKNKYEDRWKM